MTHSDRFQFGIGRLMVLTSIVALVMTVSIRISAPIIAQALFACYAIFMAGWAVMRGPKIVAELIEVNGKRKQVAQRREELMREFGRGLTNRESAEPRQGQINSQK